MKVAAWISYAEADKLTESFGGFGGWFGFEPPGKAPAHNWTDYLELVCGDDASLHAYAEALRAEIVERRLWEDGGWHQCDDEGVPQFEDGTVASFSFRAWGDLLAAVWTEQLGRQYCYMDFYYGGCADKPDDFEARAARGVKP